MTSATARTLSAIALAIPFLAPAGTMPPLPHPDLPPGVQDVWWQEASRGIRGEEYAVAGRGDGSLAAPNPAQGWEVAFDDLGFRVSPGDGSWSWGLALEAWGRPGALERVASAHPVADGTRVEYARERLTEWLENRPDGLEHGFTIPVRPAGEGRLALDLRLSGTLRPVLDADGQAVDLFAPGGMGVLRYAKLVVTDARGARLPARLEALPGKVRISVDDAAAVYPVTVDPLATSPAWTGSGDQNDAYLGFSVGTAGDVNGDGYADAIVGAYLHDAGAGAGADRGRAYVYLGSASGLSASPAWVASGDENVAGLGYRVGTAGDVNGDGFSDAIVSAVGHDAGAGAGADRGRTYLYLGSAAGLSATPAWTVSGDENGAVFGISAGAAGDVNGDGYADVIVGAYQHDAGAGAGADRGRAYVYLGSPSGPATSPTWVGSGDENGANFGVSADTAGDVNGDGYTDLAVGAYLHNAGGADRGRAYVYLGSAAGPATSPAWIGSGDENSALYGFGTVTAGDVNGDGYADLIVGAYVHDAGAGAAANRGRAYVYLGSAGGLQTAPAWTGSGDENGALFGYAVGTAGDVNGDGYADVIVGAPYHDAGAGSGADRGRAYVYLGSATGIAASSSWTGSGDENVALFGCAAGTAGDVNGDGYSDVIVGISDHDAGAGAGANRGRAQAYLGSAAGPATGAAWVASGDESGAYFALSVSAAGDVNGDGYSDVIAGSPYHDAGAGSGADRGRAYLYLGSAAGPSTAPAWVASGDENGAYFGWSAHTAGDVNGDGRADVIVGARTHDAGGPPGADRGRAYLYLGTAAGLAAAPVWTASGDVNFARLGYSAGTAGDVNGDGYSDVIVGAGNHAAGSYDRGRAYVYLGSVAGLSATPAWTVSGDEDGAELGRSVATAGDVDGDGFSDVIVASWLQDAGGFDRGRVSVYLGSASGLAISPGWSASGDQDNAHFGTSVGTAGDVNGDGYSDVITGAWQYDAGGADRGRAFVYLGSAAGLAAAPAWTATGDENSAYLGASAGTAGDVNGDGYSDVIVGAYFHDGGGGAGANRGRAYVHLGSATGPATLPAWTASGDENGATLGSRVVTAGDVNGDGAADVIVGAVNHDAGGGAGADRGRAYLHLGNGGPGAPLRPRQLRSDLSAPIAPLGAAHQQAFRLGLTLRSATGRTRARIEWQRAKLGESFVPALNPILRDPTWWSAAGPGPARTIPATFPDAPMPYTWRARVVYHPGSSPYLLQGPWVTLSENGLSETDLLSTTQPPPSPCTAPDEAVLIAIVTLNAQGMPVLHVQDPNQPAAVTGYNVYRATSPPGPFAMVASDVVDMDAGTPDVQWVDQNGAAGGPYYYRVNAYNHGCGAEGP